MKTENTAKEIFEYMRQCLAHGVHISKKNEKEMVKEIAFMIDTN